MWSIRRPTDPAPLAPGLRGRTGDIGISPRCGQIGDLAPPNPFFCHACSGGDLDKPNAPRCLPASPDLAFPSALIGRGLELLDPAACHKGLSRHILRSGQGPSSVFHGPLAPVVRPQLGFGPRDRPKADGKAEGGTCDRPSYYEGASAQDHLLALAGRALPFPLASKKARQRHPTQRVYLQFLLINQLVRLPLVGKKEGRGRGDKDPPATSLNTKRK